MPYIQSKNPIPKTGCGRRRIEQMSNPFKLMEKKIIKKSKARMSSKPLTGTKERIKMDKAREEELKARRKNTPMKKISGPCKAAAKRKFKVWPSAYASGWGVRCTKAGGPSKFGG